MTDFRYKTNGTCSIMITFSVEGDKVHNVRFTGGCHGNLQGIPRLVEGMSCADVIARLDGIICKDKDTSCCDQLARALKMAVQTNSAVQGQAGV